MIQPTAVHSSMGDVVLGERPAQGHTATEGISSTKKTPEQGVSKPGPANQSAA